ncbi:MAG: hypothetical protein L0Y75_02865, partial [Acidobacteria bacterium]|nr:hypothetical protein [Acidobacteriota bacterium]
MRPSLRLSTRTILIACCLTTIAAFTGIALRRSEGYSNAGKASTAIIQSGTPPRFDVERVSLRPTGFDPSQITRLNKNPFFLIIENRTGLGELILQIEDETGKRVNNQEMISMATDSMNRQVTFAYSVSAGS